MVELARQQHHVRRSLEEARRATLVDRDTNRFEDRLGPAIVERFGWGGSTATGGIATVGRCATSSIRTATYGDKKHKKGDYSTTSLPAHFQFSH